jgi:hypothetical protein
VHEIGMKEEVGYQLIQVEVASHEEVQTSDVG